ncbi:amylo-alpha-1,6-glucosidase [Silvibacterium dinghuense]|uniref:Glycogen debranching protein n=1 Tax=Silvibacterium dinghuense TaxID=1560006 RepID=A0A4Q1SJW0_9BACT|nr:glycogen debranching protein [Silvibacterium dinghuense]RXS97958.1 glycogen debranching protein [Silvibacterium dinghuense]
MLKAVLYPSLFLAGALASSFASGQTSALPAPDNFVSSTPAGGLSIARETVAGKPFSVLGPRGALLGEQDGRYEAWIFPWKIFSGMRITANMQDYPVPIDVNDHAAWIDVQPERTIITYSHANFTVRQIMVAPKQATDGAGVNVYYQIEAVRPMTLTFSFEPIMQRMWPAMSDDKPSPEWVVTQGGSGYYILHGNTPEYAGALAMPGAESGILPPYQERAAAWPLQFVLHFDPKKDAGKLFPLLMTVASDANAATKEALGQKLTALDASASADYRANADYYRKFVDTHASLDSPDANLNAAFSWAEVAIDQLRVLSMDRKEEALTAGFVGSGDAARPGFGWFFGRDALWSLYAVNSYGDFDTTKREIEFLLHRQSPEGKIMHEWSQTATLVDWKSLPYEYASADATELLPMAMDDYLNISGDAAFIRSHWDQIAKAWSFETSHDSADGIYNNSQGSGWVESWIPSMPQQEIYMAALDEQASLAFSRLAEATGHGDLAAQARERAGKIRATIEKEYYLPEQKFYAFSHNADGTTDNTATIFPAVTWWDGDAALAQPQAMLDRWASAEFSTDWGTRILSDKTSFYDPISYHQGSVWPLFTGWVSVAEYRAGRPLSGYAHLMQNANLTWAQDLGATTELLSGQFYQVLGRSTAHQLWSSAMVVSPILRGMFGLGWNAADHTISVAPQLPAAWDHATLRNLPLGEGKVDLSFTRRGQTLLVTASGSAGVKLISPVAGAKVAGATVMLPLPAVEAGIRSELPPFGDETRQLKVLNEEWSGHTLTLTLAAQSGSTQQLDLRVNDLKVKPASGDAKIGEEKDGVYPLSVPFSGGDGYVTKTVTIRW